MNAAQALADLTEISAQIEGAVLAAADGTVVAATFPDEERSGQLAAAAGELVPAAEDSAGELRARRLVQVLAATPQGCLFVARDERHLVAAVTGPQPTVGLVFYDLKSCLRLVEREEEAEEAKPVPRKRVKKGTDGSS